MVCENVENSVVFYLFSNMTQGWTAEPSNANVKPECTAFNRSATSLRPWFWAVTWRLHAACRGRREVAKTIWLQGGIAYCKWNLSATKLWKVFCVHKEVGDWLAICVRSVAVFANLLVLIPWLQLFLTASQSQTGFSACVTRALK